MCRSCARARLLHARIIPGMELSWGTGMKTRCHTM